MSYEVLDVRQNTKRWYEERRKSAGASDMAGILGESIFDDFTPLSVYFSKLGAESKFDPVHSYTAHRAEPLIAGWVRKFHTELGRVRPGFMARSVEYPWMHASFDRVLEHPTDGLVPLQLKTSSPFNRHKWENGPLSDYVAQEDAECLVLGSKVAYLAVWHYGPRDYEIYRMEVDEARQLEAAERARVFMQENVAKRIPPAPQLGDNMTLLYPGFRGEPIVASDEALDAFGKLVFAKDDLKSQSEILNADIDQQKFVLEKFMGNATDLLDPVTNTPLHYWRPDKNGIRSHRPTKDGIAYAKN